MFRPLLRTAKITAASVGGNSTPQIAKAIPPPSQQNVMVNNANTDNKEKDAPNFRSASPPTPLFVPPQQTQQVPVAYAWPVYYVVQPIQPTAAPMVPPQQMYFDGYSYQPQYYYAPPQQFFYPPSNTTMTSAQAPPSLQSRAASTLRRSESTTSLNSVSSMDSAFSTMSLSTSTTAQSTMNDDGLANMVGYNWSTEQLAQFILTHLEKFPKARLSLLNRLLSKTNTKDDWRHSLRVFGQYQLRRVEMTPETGTLLIKAGCRAGAPEEVLALLTNVQQVKIFPTLGGLHYLMINFSLTKNHESVFKAFEVCKLRYLSPNQRTFHILIRECVDGNHVEQALEFANVAEKEGVIPNRVTFNILMNGCRKINKPEQILNVRTKMDAEKIELNDTTVKFTALAYMMLGKEAEAVSSFAQYKEAGVELPEFCSKFVELIEEEGTTPEQKAAIQNLFNVVEKAGTKIPTEISAKLK